MDTFTANEEHSTRTKENQDHGNDEIQTLPGFRFHPTDEELVGFYLRAKVDKKSMKIDHLIQEIDIYKQNPWDLPKTKNDGGSSDQFMYFFCKRGRKYRNSERPNRVTGSGFWKATGIDKPIHTLVGGVEGYDVIGLKKTLVYYRGSAGKGTKTDWMMHELRLPNANTDLEKPATQEAEVWTVCRIFRRSIPNKSYTGNWRELPSKQVAYSKNNNCTTMVDLGLEDPKESYISFASPTAFQYDDGDDDDKRYSIIVDHPAQLIQNQFHMNEGSEIFNDSSLIAQAPSATSSTSHFNATDLQMEDQLISNYETWDELRFVVDQ